MSRTSCLFRLNMTICHFPMRRQTWFCSMPPCITRLISKRRWQALRALDKSGKIVILDSPVYHNPRSGTQMVHEREAQFVRQYGFASNSLQSENYLTYGRLNELARA